MKHWPWHVSLPPGNSCQGYWERRQECGPPVDAAHPQSTQAIHADVFSPRHLSVWWSGCVQRRGLCRLYFDECCADRQSLMIQSEQRVCPLRWGFHTDSFRFKLADKSLPSSLQLGTAAAAGKTFHQIFTSVRMKRASVLVIRENKFSWPCKIRCYLSINCLYFHRRVAGT